MRPIIPALIAAAAAASCGGDKGTTPPPGGSQNPPAATLRLAWSQAAPTQAALNAYGYILFVDGSRMPLSGVSCSAAAADYDCSAPLPSLSTGTHVLEMTTVDNTTAVESSRSESIVFNGGPTAPRREDVTASASTTAATDAALEGPSLTCVSGNPSTCFVVAPMATGLAAIERLATLPDNRVLAVLPGGITQVLPGGEPQRLDINRGQPVNVAAVTVDPEFLSNRFVYLATVATSTDGRDRVSIVRMRELAGSLGEAATIAAELPAAQGRPVLSIGPDGRLYLALPSARGQRAPYDGLVLRLTRDGAAAGYEPARSPVLAVGSDRPSSFAWLDDGRLLLASTAVAQGVPVGVVPVSPDASWPAQMTPLQAGSQGWSAGGFAEIAAVPPAGDGIPESRFFLLGLDPAALYVARMAAGPAPDVHAVNPIPLGPWMPSALAVDARGDALVAARRAGDSRVSLLRVHAR